MTRQRFHLDDAVAVRLPRTPPKTTFGSRKSPEGQRITDYMTEIEPLLRPWLDVPEREVGIVLQIGLPAGTDLLTHHDLDNFLEPLATHLGPSRVTFAAASKAHGETSWLRIGEPRRAAEREWEGWRLACLSCTDTGAEAKRGLARTLAAKAEPLPSGAVELDLAVRVGPGRNWVNAWKPLIDALVPILGRLPGKPEFDIEDGRITSLALHRTVDPNLRNEIGMDLRWRMVSSTGDGPVAACPELIYEVGASADTPPSPVRNFGDQRTALGRQESVTTRVTSLDTFRALQSDGRGFVVITDNTKPPRLHRWDCVYVREDYFQTKVIDNRMTNGEYFAVDDAEHARQRWPTLVSDICV